MSVCDAHIHLFAGGYAGRSGASPAGGEEASVYDELRAQHDIESALVVGYTAEARYHGNNADILALAAHHRWMRPLAYVDAGAGPADARAALAAGFYGLSVYATDRLGPQETAELLSRIATPLVERRGLLSINVIPGNYRAVLDVSEQFPELRILLSHLGLPAAGARTPADVAAALAWLPRLAAGPNTRVKVSGGYALGGSDPTIADICIVAQLATA
ncbi:MAG: amidohydrolase family protein, partial [Actinobacteria bacterium]|nr:amidohydrolase family protein [Actinomycetota bacterium]